jgi:hypothetical protein
VGDAPGSPGVASPLDRDRVRELVRLSARLRWLHRRGTRTTCGARLGDRDRLGRHERERSGRDRLASTTSLSSAPALEAGRLNYEQTDARFRAGLGSAVEVVDAETMLAESEIRLAEGRYELARARAIFGRSIAEGAEVR